jgi:hypothetical protein
MRGYIGAFTLCLMAASGMADDSVARWVDSNGVTHFGSPQFAPADAARVPVNPANGMAAPAQVPATSGSSGTVWTVIDLPPRQNRVGWRSKGDGPNNGPISPSQR